MNEFSSMNTVIPCTVNKITKAQISVPLGWPWPFIKYAGQARPTFDYPNYVS